MSEITIGALLLLAVLQFAALGVLWHQTRQLKRDIGRLSGSLAHIAQTDVPTSMLVTALGRMERCIARIEEQPAPVNLTPYELAQQLAREGADVEQMVARCGLTGDEARLMRQLHAVTQ